MSDTIQLPIEIVLDDGKIQNAFIKIEKQAEKAAKNASDNLGKGIDFKSFGKAALGFGAALGAVGVALAGVGFKKAVDEAREGERVINSFNASLFAAGKFTQEASNRFVEYSESLEKTLGVSKSVTLEGAKLLVSIGKLSGEGLERATQASLDLAAGLGKDASTGFALISKLAAGNTEVLSSYGIKLDENIPKNQRYAAALKLIEERFGGLAKTSSQTLDGALARLALQFNNIFENIGQLVTNSPVIRKAIDLIAEAFGKIADSLKNLDQLSFDQMIIDALNFTRAITGFLLPAIEAIYDSFRFLWHFINQTFQGVGFVIVKGVADGLTFLDILLKKFGINTLDSITGTMQEIKEATFGVLQETTLKTREAFKSIFDDEVASGINQNIDSFIAKLNKAKGTISGLKDQVISFVSVAEGFSYVADGIKESALDMATNAEKNFKSMGKAMLQSIGQGAGQAFASFGKALATGENALEAFGQSLLSAFGNALIQLGTGFILQGIAQSISGFGSGAPLIAAGAALAAFGGLISASAGGGSTASVGGGGVSTGGGVAAEPSATTEINEDTQVAEAKPTVSVVVQGNILDRRESGLEIVNILQEAFDTQGARVVGMA